MWRVPRWPMDIRLVPPVPFSPPDSSIRCGSMGSRAENGSAWTPSNRCVSWQRFGEIIMKRLWLCATAIIFFVALAHTANARSAYDGSWDLVFVTQRGACDPTYNFTVNISNGVVTHPNLVRFRGYVAKSGAVRASVTVQDKYASGSGRLSSTSGRGTWSGYAGNARCSGYWTAQRN